ncbi:hypothetical protein CsatB_000449 [Cannabis sativa]|uniref:EF-hand domain-containing protein n=2 Tax=Cannabis sativa TaxID=3483 RepID=A0AB40E9K4_CANSA|nr:hypothetical protein G4B88_001661 [Cannabis sativa]
MGFGIGTTFCNQKGSEKGHMERQTVIEFIKQYDRDNNGELSKDEAKQVFKTLGSKWSSRRTRQAMKFSDKDEDRSINLNDSYEFDSFIDYILGCGYKLKTTTRA